MEDKLDAIARGEKGRVEYLSEYYLGEEGLKATVAGKREMIDPVEAKRARLPGLEVGERLTWDVKVGSSPCGGWYAHRENDGAEVETGSVRRSV